MKHAHLLKDPKLPRMNLEPIKMVLQDLMPALSPGPRGRLRLIRALTQRYGENFRAFKDAQQAMEHFDNETKLVRDWLKLKGVQSG